MTNPHLRIKKTEAYKTQENKKNRQRYKLLEANEIHRNRRFQIYIYYAYLTNKKRDRSISN